jgi:hypothetical protein
MSVGVISKENKYKENTKMNTLKQNLSAQDLSYN